MSHCPHCEWLNIYASTHDGSRELEFYEHMQDNHPDGAA